MNSKKGLFFIIIGIVLLFAFETGLEARTWNVFPKMSREEIQEKIDLAEDGDTIKFHRGIYDFSQEPILSNYCNEGLFNIIDKSLTIIGKPGHEIIGPDSENAALIDAHGLAAFHFLNLDADKDIIFRDLNIKNFLRGIHSGYVLNNDPTINLPNGHKVVVIDCCITDIHRDCLSIHSVQGDVIVENNRLEPYRVGIIIWWKNFSEIDFWQPENQKIIIKNNTITDSIYGIYTFRTFNGKITNNVIDCWWGMVIQGNKELLDISSNLLSGKDGMRYGIYLSGNIRDGYEEIVENVHIKSNSIQDIETWGITLGWEFTQNNIASHNDIQMNGGSVAWSSGVFTEGSQNKIMHNRISGTGGWAIYLCNWGIVTHDEYVYMNSVEDFIPLWTHYYLDYQTYNNTVIGNWEEGVYYINDGDSSNLVEGIYPQSSTTSRLSGNKKAIKNNRKLIIDM